MKEIINKIMFNGISLSKIIPFWKGSMLLKREDENIPDSKAF